MFFITEAKQIQPDDCLKIVSYELSPYKIEEFNSNFFATALDKSEKLLRCLKCQRVMQHIKTIQEAIKHSDVCRGIKNQTSSNDKKENSAIITPMTSDKITNRLKEARKRKRKRAKKRKRQSHENVTSAKKSKFEIIGDNSSQNVRSWSSLYIAAANHKFVSLETKLHLERRGEPVIG